MGVPVFQRCNLDRPIVWRLLGASLFAMATISVFLHPLHHDVAWFLYGSGRLIDGAKLYQDIVDVKPPLIFYWYIPPVWVGHVMRFGEVTSFKTYLLLWAVLSLVICKRVLNQALWSSPPILRRCLLLVILLIFLPSYSFGQSEHIMLILVMPYVLVAIARANGSPMSRGFLLFIGGLAGLGLAQKPHFLFLWLMIEIYLTLISQKRLSWLRLENLGIVMVLALYGAFILVGAPDYYREIVPMAMQVYGAYSCDIFYLLKNPVTKLWVVTFLALLVVRPTAYNRETRRIFLIASASYLVIAFAQLKGFSYHFYPVKATAVLLLMVVVLDSAETIGAIRKVIGPRKAVIVLLIILGLFSLSGLRAIRLFQRTDDPLLSPLVHLVQEHAEGEPIFLLSSSSFPAFPLVNYSGARWSSRFNCLWLLPGLYSDASLSERRVLYHSRDEMDALERFFVDAVISDILKCPPTLLIVDSSLNKQGFGKTTFDYVDYFLHDRRFAELWTDYEFLTAVEQYRVFKRSGGVRFGSLRSTQWTLGKDQTVLART